MSSRQPPALDLGAIVADPQVRTIVCCGAGGVGKTTTAAALGVRAAQLGRQAVVLTIDPAKRLAQALGVGELDNTPRRVPGITGTPGGSLDAMMLDMKRTFDEIILAHADPARAEAILNNPFYQSLSSSLAGTQEYMAMEKLGQLRRQADRDGTWDLMSWTLHRVGQRWTSSTPHTGWGNSWTGDSCGYSWPPPVPAGGPTPGCSAVDCRWPAAC